MEKEKEKATILANWIMCPDGTMLPSMNQHDYRTHETVDTFKPRSIKMDDHHMVPDKTRHSMVDGGSEYLRRGGKFTEMTVYSDDPYEVIRRFVCRGGRGKDGTHPLTYVPLMAMSNQWLQAVLEYNKDLGINNPYDKYYKLELEYRTSHNIFIKDTNE